MSPFWTIYALFAVVLLVLLDAFAARNGKERNERKQDADET